MSAKDGSLHEDTWTTSFACPGFDCYLRMPVLDAVEAGYMPKEFVDAYIENSWIDYKKSMVSKMTFDCIELAVCVSENNKNINIPCVVSNRCRNYKGEGVLIRVIKCLNTFTSYRKTYKYYAKVLGVDGKIHTMAAHCVDFDINSIRERINSMIPNVQDTSEFFSIFPILDINKELANAVDVEYETKMYKWNKEKDEKFPSLLEWCKSKRPAMDDAEIRKWAETIYNRNHPLPEY